MIHFYHTMLQHYRRRLVEAKSDEEASFVWKQIKHYKRHYQTLLN